MSAVLTAQESGARFLTAAQPGLVRRFDLLAGAPGGVARLRELIRTLAVQGKIVPQDSTDEDASLLLLRMANEKAKRAEGGRTRRNSLGPGQSGGDAPYNLPSNWSWSTVEELCTLVTDGEHATPQRCDDITAVPLVTAKNVRSEAMDYTQTDFVPRDVAERCWRRCKPQPGDILMVSVGATLGRLCVLREPREMVLVRSVTVLRPASIGINPSYLALHLMAPATQVAIWASVKQSAQPCLYLAKSAALEIALPPLAEQARIVARVDELMRLCDTLEAKGRLEAEQHARLLGTLLGTLTDSSTPEELAANWQRVADHFDLLLDRPEAVDALEQTILQLAVRGLLVPQDPSDEPAKRLVALANRKDNAVIEARPEGSRGSEGSCDGLDQLPAGWQQVQLFQVAETRLGKMLDKAKNRGLPKPYLRNTNVQWRRFELDDIKVMNLEESELAEFRLVAGDLLICEGGEPGRCAIWQEDARELYFQKALHRVRPRAGVSAEYIAIALESDALSGALSLYFTGATIQHFVGQALQRYTFPLPPTAEQARIVGRVTELRHLCAALRQRLAASQTTQSHLAEALVEQAAA